jgi:hypothetical protein
MPKKVIYAWPMSRYSRFRWWIVRHLPWRRHPAVIDGLGVAE